MKIFRTILLGAFVLLIMGCSHKEVPFSFITDRSFKLDEIDNYKISKKYVKGEDITNTFLFFTTKSDSDNNAIKSAIKKVPRAVGLAYGKITYGFWTTLLFGRSYVLVEGYPVIKKSSLDN